MTQIPPAEPPPNKLDYSGANEYQPFPTTPKWAQALLGFGSWFLGLAVVAGIIIEGNQVDLPSALILGLCIACVVGMVVLVFVASRRAWTAFLPGFLLAIASSCLLIGIICGNVRF